MHTLTGKVSHRHRRVTRDRSGDRTRAAGGGRAGHRSRGSTRRTCRRPGVSSRVQAPDPSKRFAPTCASYDDVGTPSTRPWRGSAASTILVNNAGVGVFADVADMTPEQWARVIDTNLTGVFYACHAALPHLRKRGGGFIVNISSLAGKNAFTGGSAYCASKSGLNAFSEALMQEVRYDNIRVSYVMPGSVATGFSGER